MVTPTEAAVLRGRRRGVRSSLRSWRAIAPPLYGGGSAVPMGSRAEGSSVDEVGAGAQKLTGVHDRARAPSAGPAPVDETIPSTRAGRTWIRVLPALVVLAVTVVFILQNRRSAKVSFITASGRLPLGVALLIAAALGALVVLALGSVRIVQLRRLVRRSTHEHRRRHR